MVNIKTPFTVMNGLLVVLGAAGIGLAAYAREKDVVELVGQTWFVPAVCLGVFVLLLGMMGCVGGCGNNKCLLYVYSLLTFIIAVCVLGTGAYSVQSGGAENGRLIIDRAWNAAHESLLESVEVTYECCGLDELESRCATIEVGMQVEVVDDQAKIQTQLADAKLPSIDQSDRELAAGKLAIITEMYKSGFNLAFNDNDKLLLLAKSSVTPTSVVNDTLAPCTITAKCYNAVDPATWEANCTAEASCTWDGADSLCTSSAAAEATCRQHNDTACKDDESCGKLLPVAPQKLCGDVLLEEFKSMYIPLGVTAVFLALFMLTSFGISLRLACVGDSGQPV